MDDLFSVSTTQSKDKKLRDEMDFRKNNSFQGEDLFSKNSNKNKKNKKENKGKNKEKNNIIKITIVFSIILILFVLGVIYIFNKNRVLPAKPFILEIFKKADITKPLNLENYIGITNSMNNKSYEVVSSGKMDPKFLNEDKKEEKNDSNANTEAKKDEEDKLKIRDFEFVLNGAVNNGEKKSNTIKTSLLWDKTSVSSFTTLENDDLILIDAPEYFKEKIGINKANIDKIIKNDTGLVETYKDLLNSKDNNIFEELSLLLDAIQKSVVSTVESLNESNFTVEKNVSTTYKNEKMLADNYTMHLNNISLNLIFENIKKDVETSMKIDSSRYKVLNKNKDIVNNIIKTLKPEIGDQDKLDLVFYKLKSDIPMCEAILKSGGQETKIFRLEKNKDEKKDKKELNEEVTVIFGDTKIKVSLQKAKGRDNLNIDFETLKKDLKNIKPNDIKIQNPNIKETKTNTEEKPADITSSRNISKIEEINAHKYALFTSNEQNNEEGTEESSQKINEDKKVETNEVLEIKDKTIKNKNIDNILNAKEDEKIFFKISFKTPENTNASNMEININVYSNIIDLDLNTVVTFKEGIVIDMFEGDRIFLDELEDSERKAMIDNLIKPTIISITAKKLDDIAKQKKSIENSNKDVDQRPTVTENISSEEMPEEEMEN